MNYELLYQNFNRYTHISEADYYKIEPFLIRRFLKKRRAILNQGEISRYLFFVLQGSLRSFSIDAAGNEHIMQFAFEGHWISDLSSFITQTPGEMVVEAMEDAEILLLPHHELDLLLNTVPAFEKYFRHLYQRAYVTLMSRVNMRDSIPAKERYKTLIAQQPNIAKRVPLLYIASYLGITAESLSRLRGMMANEK